MSARLVAVDEGPDILVEDALIVAGRHQRCDVRLSSIRVSRRHCCLAPDRDGVIVRDLGSTNGTWINGRRVEVAVLRPGDELAIAHLRYHLEVGRPEERIPSPAGRGSHEFETIAASRSSAHSSSGSETTLRSRADEGG